MRPIFIISLFCFFNVFNLNAQSKTLNLIDINTKIDTRSNPKLITLNLYLSLPNKNYQVKGTSINNSQCNIVIGDKKYTATITSFKGGGITIKSQLEVDDIAKRLEELKLNHYVEIDQPLVFKIVEVIDPDSGNIDPSKTKTVTISETQISKWTKNAFFKLTKDQKEALINEKGGEAIIAENSIDIGYVSESESVSGNNEVNVSFKYRDYWKNSTKIGYSFEGLLSTNSKDSLNYFSMYPLISNLGKLDKEGNYNIIGKAGVEGNQTFSNYRISANLSIQGIIPNLIDLTAGENRLRLKPVINVGIKFYNEVKNNRRINTDNEVSNQVFTDFYYYIPIHKSFSLTVNGTAFYDLSKKINPSKKISYNFDATLGFIVSKGFKTVFKYTKGNNIVTFERGDFFSIGVLSDIFSGVNQ
ncbi:MAG: hypothetical protein HWD85_12545 [Flavobacteriaceae bacterium]|nr:hypothetical protein [Flavobacteriaceae bacterium]